VITYPCRCPGKGKEQKPSTLNEVRGWEVTGVQETLDAENPLVLMTCPGCGCTHSLEHKDAVPPGASTIRPSADHYDPETGIYTPDAAAPRERRRKG